MKTLSKIFIVLFCLVLGSLLLSIPLTIMESFRIVFGSFFVLFLPGYALSFLFFRESESIERIALSFALSLAVVPLVMFYLNLLGVKIRILSVVLVISSIVVLSVLLLYFKDKKRD